MSLERARGGHWQAGAKIGGVLGLIVGFAVATVDSEGAHKPTVLKVIGMMAGFGLAFAVPGALIGSAFPKRE